MKSQIIYTINSIKKEMINLSEEIFKNPELGFKEFEVLNSLWDENNPCQIYVMAV